MEDILYRVLAPLSQGAPGDDASTLRALGEVPDHDAVRRAIDLGVGRGRTTLALARALRNARITAVDIHAPFIGELSGLAREAGVADRIRPVCGRMEDLDVDEGSMDLVWAEGSIYAIGMQRALARWRPWLRPGGFLAFSDIAWWTGEPSEESRAHWDMEYPDMADESTVLSRSEAAGYRVAGGFRMSKEAHEAYYAPLEARAEELDGNPEAGIRKAVADLRREIETMRRFSEDAGYTFFVLQRPDA